MTLSFPFQFFWRRRNLMVKPLLKEAGIGGIILENPFYGLRKPTDQVYVYFFLLDYNLKMIELRKYYE